MGVLQPLDAGSTSSGERLRARHLIGRSRLAHLQLHEPEISGEHALILWTGEGWEVHDLGSRNGTFLDGRRLEPGARALLPRGAIVGFGSNDRGWRLADDSPPTAMALPWSEGQARCAVAGFLALPDEDDPQITIYRSRAGGWMMEQDGDSTRIEDGQEISAGGQSFTLVLPDPLPPTWSTQRLPPSLDSISLRFAVSQDEEYVTLQVLHEGRVIDLGPRAHHYLLLTLARARLRDRQEDHPAGARGWIYLEELAPMLAMDEKHLNVAVFRCREQLAAAGISNAADVIERRKSTRQIRLGTESVEIVRV